MNTQLQTNYKNRSQSTSNRSLLLSGLPVTQHQFDLAGISTAVLMGGEGPPIVLLHGPGETSLWWLRVIPILVKTHRVIVPDLPGHGESKVKSGTLDTDSVFPWLGKLIKQCCSSSPVLVGHILGGAIAARFAIEDDKQLRHLVLVDSLGLGKFRPAPTFALGLIRFLLWPTEKNYNRFMPQCIYDADSLEKKMGNKWEPFLKYNLECAQEPDSKTALQALMKQLGVPKLPSDKLEQIQVPTTLIWGRYDRANKLQIAERANQHYGWPLHVIEDARDDPKLEQPEAFTDALFKTLNRKGVNHVH